MPIVSHFDPRPAVRLWMTDKQRRNVEPQKSDSQKWFASMFALAKQRADEKKLTELSDKICF